MTTGEILELIDKGERFLQRNDITDKQRESAEERYSNLVAQLAKAEDEEINAPEPNAPIDPRILESMNKIRSILGMPLRTG